MKNKTVIICLVLLSIFLISLNTGFAVPAAPSPTCKITAEITKVVYKAAYFQEDNGMSCNAGGKNVPAQYLLNVKINKISTANQDGSNSCDALYPVNSEKTLTIYASSINIGDSFKEKQVIEGNIHFDGDECGAGVYLSNYKIISETTSIPTTAQTPTVVASPTATGGGVSPAVPCTGDNCEKPEIPTTTAVPTATGTGQTAATPCASEDCKKILVTEILTPTATTSGQVPAVPCSGEDCKKIVSTTTPTATSVITQPIAIVQKIEISPTQATATKTCKEGCDLNMGNMQCVCPTEPPTGITCSVSVTCEKGTSPSFTGTYDKSNCPIYECVPTATICPEGCTCNKDSITCKMPETNTPIQASIATPTGTEEVALEKTEGTLSIKTGESIATTAENLVIENSKLYIKTDTANKEIKIMPDTASLNAVTTLQLKNIQIELKDTGIPTYEITGTKDVKVLGIFKAEMQITTNVNAENGNIETTDKPWWAFLATE